MFMKNHFKKSEFHCPDRCWGCFLQCKSMEWIFSNLQITNVQLHIRNLACTHGLRTPGEKIVFTARPKIKPQSQIFRSGRSIFCLSHRPKISDFFDLCLHWVSVVRACTYHKKWNLFKIRASCTLCLLLGSEWHFLVLSTSQICNKVYV